MISSFQAPVTSTPGVAVTIPPGPCTVTFANAGTATIYLGGPGVTASTGYPVAARAAPVSIPGFTGSGPFPVYAVTPGSPSLGPASSSVPGVFDPGAAVPASPGASGGDTAYLGITVQS